MVLFVKTGAGTSNGLAVGLFFYSYKRENGYLKRLVLFFILTKGKTNNATSHKGFLLYPHEREN